MKFTERSLFATTTRPAPANSHGPSSSPKRIAPTAALIADDEVRAGVRAVTEEAVARGMFGAPTFFVNGEMYWGQDRLFMVEAALAAA